MNYSTNGKFLYQGDLIEGDRLATPQEVSAHQVQIIQATLTYEIQKRLDDFAKTRGYDGILSACTYATSAVPRFKSDADYCVAKRDETWAAAYAILEMVQAGNHSMPQSIADIESELPALEWPA